MKHKKMMRMFVKILSLQILMICLFIYALTSSQPVSTEALQEADITVEEVYRVYKKRGGMLKVIADSETYVFHNGGSSELSAAQLSKRIFAGDQLCISYVERDSLFGTRKVVVAARSDSEVYRTLEVYNSNREKGAVPLCILFLLMEGIFLFCASGFFMHYKNELKALVRKQLKKFK